MLPFLPPVANNQSSLTHMSGRNFSSCSVDFTNYVDQQVDVGSKQIYEAGKNIVDNKVQSEHQSDIDIENTNGKMDSESDRGDDSVHLTHVDSAGNAKMVDVGGKRDSVRTALARGSIVLGREAYMLVVSNQVKKGDVLTVAQLAGIMGAKQTSNLIPLCHPLLLNKIEVNLYLDQTPGAYSVIAEAQVECSGKTGVEMEALSAVSVALLTVYDMCKAVTKDMVITDVHLVSKKGGKSDYQALENCDN